MLRNLLPGYVFLETAYLTPAEMSAIRTIPYVLKFLRYANGEFALHPNDLMFYQWLKMCNGIVDVSRVYKQGDRIRVIEGPLKDYEGDIVSVNTKRKCVAIQLGEKSLMCKVWCSIEMVEQIKGTEDVVT